MAATPQMTMASMVGVSWTRVSMGHLQSPKWQRRFREVTKVLEAFARVQVPLDTPQFQTLPKRFPDLSTTASRWNKKHTII